MLHRQKITQELNSDAIRQQRGPPDFLTEQFRGAAFGEQRGDGTPTVLLVRLAGTGIQAWAGERQFAKEGSHADLVMSLAQREVAGSAGTGAVAPHTPLLARGHDLLDTGQHLFSLIQP